MSIITISRGSFSRGKEVAEKLSRKLGYECISREVLLEASSEFNIPEIKLSRALHDAPTMFERLSRDKEDYIGYIRSALLQHVKEGNVVYHGLAGHYFLLNVPSVLKVRIIADMNDRVREEMKRENISADKALAVLKRDDDERRHWGLKLYGIDTWDSRLYDVVLNVKTMSVDDAVDLLHETIQKPVFQSTPESVETIRDLALSAKVQANIVKIAPELLVKAEGETVYIDSRVGTLIESREEDRIREVVSKIEGVGRVVMNKDVANRHHDYVNPFHNI